MNSSGEIFAVRLWRLVRAIGLIWLVLIGLFIQAYAAIAISVTSNVAALTIASGSTLRLPMPVTRLPLTYVVTNSGNFTVANVAPIDAGPKFNGIAGTNSLRVFTLALVAARQGGDIFQHGLAAITKAWAFTAQILRPPRSLLTTKVASASPSMSSAMIRNGLEV